MTNEQLKTLRQTALEKVADLIKEISGIHSCFKTEFNIGASLDLGLLSAKVKRFRTSCATTLTRHVSKFEAERFLRIKARSFPKDLHIGASSVWQFWAEDMHNYLKALSEEFQKHPERVLLLPQKSPTTTSATSLVLRICDNFHVSVLKLRNRKHKKPDFEIRDEYDVQDMLVAILSLFFQDVRPEEATPSKAGGSGRMDILLKQQKIVVETKMMRDTLTTKKCRDELLVDKEIYAQHSDCETLICLVYDPENRIANPHGFEQDLAESKENGFKVIVKVVPKASSAP